MKFLLDTCALSELRKRNANSGLVQWAQGIDEARLYLSVIALAEIQKGITKLEESSKKAELQNWLDQDLTNRFSGRILPVDLETALTWGILLGKGENKGSPVPVVDCLIAATAVKHNLTVVTRNANDFERFPVQVIDPWTDD